MKARTQRGLALLISLIVLSLLSLVAVLSLRHLSLNLRAGEAYSGQLLAFNASETARAALIPVLAAHLQQRGWPRRWGGSIEDSAFPDSPGIRLSSTTLRSWYLSNTEKSASFAPLALDADAQYENALGDAELPIQLQATLAVYRLRASLLDGGNAAFAQGYEGTGAGLAGGGGAVLFYLHSEGRTAEREASAITGAVYRQVLSP